MSGYRVITNNVPRDIVDSYELTASERKEFDYLDWDALDAGEDSASFFRYRGQVYDLGEFMADGIAGWHGYRSDSYFSAIVVRLVEDGDRIVVGLLLA